MTAETARQFDALEGQARRIVSVFVGAGYEAVAPAMIQPAGVFLDAIGEALRARTYVFSDQDGTELCLRPDLTVPTCRLHLERFPDGSGPARYCYNGAAFRYQPAGAGSAHPREFRQAGIETIGAADPLSAEADTLAVMVEAIDAAGLPRRLLRLRFGDLGLVHALLDAGHIPLRWRRLLQAQFWRPDAFRAEMKRMATDPGRLARSLPAPLLAALTANPGQSVEAAVAAHLEAAGMDVFGARSLEEIAQNVAAILEDARAARLSPAFAGLMDGYLALTAPAADVPRRIRGLLGDAGMPVSPALEEALAAFATRLDLFAERGLDIADATFSGGFGRSLEYYTGFVFEVGAPDSPLLSPIAGGGRYDGLMRLAGSPRDLPAVGAAIHTERLLRAVEEVRP